MINAPSNLSLKNIAIIDDHKLFSSGLKLLFADLDGSFEIGVYADFEEFVANKQTSYGLIVLDFYVPGSNFSESMARLVGMDFGCPIVVISASPSPADRAEALAAGAKQFINKNLDPEELIRVVSAVLNGDDLETCNINSPELADAFRDLALTPRQVDILILVAKGYSNKEIAQSYQISPETVKSHLKTIFRSIKVQNRMEAVELVRHYGAI